MRVTRDTLNNLFELLCNKFNLKRALKKGEEGYFIDYAPIYGGYCIRRNCGKGMGEEHITARQTPQQFYYQMQFALQMLKEQERENA